MNNEWHVQVYDDGDARERLATISGTLKLIGGLRMTAPWFSVEDRWTHMRVTGDSERAITEACNELERLGAVFKRDRLGLLYASFAKAELGI